jgi:hypothetical protein
MCDRAAAYFRRPRFALLTVLAAVGLGRAASAGRARPMAAMSGVAAKGIKIKKAEMRALANTGDSFHPEWNYTISPRTQHRSIILE